MSKMSSLLTGPRTVKLRVEDYMMLDKAGAFDGYGKTELLDGEVVYMNAQHRPHARMKSRLFRLLANELDALGGALEPLVEGSVSMPPHSVPEPDIAVTTEPRAWASFRSHPSRWSSKSPTLRFAAIWSQAEDLCA